MRVRYTAPALVLISALTVPIGCANTASQGLAGSEWQPVTIDGAAPGADIEQFVRFGADGKLVGAGGCNNFFGSYSLSEDSIELSPLGMTRKMCSESVMQAEAGLIRVLQEARKVERQKTALGLYDAEGQLLGNFRQTDWD